MKKRDYQIDNIKGLLIVLVVFGHMLLASYEGNNWLTTFIYSFHMPVFIFLNGIFSKHANLKKVLKFGSLYLFVQIMYILVVKITAYPWIPESNIIVTPIFHVWYLLSLFFWYLLSIIIKRFSLKPGIVLAVTVILGMSVRFINFGVDGNYFAYSRTIVFAPFFFAGYFTSFAGLLEIRRIVKRFKPILLISALLLLSMNVFYFGKNASEWMRLLFAYLNYSQFSDSYFVFFVKELLQYFLGIIAIITLLGLVPSNKGILNYLGQHTLVVFICHPVIYFIIYNYIGKASPTTLKPILISIVLSILAICWSLIIEQLLKIIKLQFSIKNKYKQKKNVSR